MQIWEYRRESPPTQIQLQKSPLKDQTNKKLGDNIYTLQKSRANRAPTK